MTVPFGLPYAKNVWRRLAPDQKEFVRQAMENRRLRHEEDAVKEALSRWEEREPRRFDILAAIDQAEASLVYAARESGGVVIASRVVEKTTDHLWLLARYP